MKRILRNLIIGGLLSFFGIMLLLFLADLWIQRISKSAVFDDSQALPCHDVALVLGASKTVKGGRTNLFFAYRIAAAADLYHAGKVKHLLLSGDNHHTSYDEPSDMKEALIQRGVPEEAITLDYAGFRTFDSIVRAKKVFGLSSLLVVSQRFHNERAIFIGKANGLSLHGFNAKDVSRRFAPKTYIREYFARVKAILDVYLLGVNPKFLGEPVHIPISSPCES